MLKFCILFILILSPLLYGGDMWWVSIPFQLLIFLSFLFNYKKIFQNKLNYSKNLLIPWILLTGLLLISSFFSTNINMSIKFFVYYCSLSILFIISSKVNLDQKEILKICLIIIFFANLQTIISVLQKIEILSHSHWNPPMFLAGTFCNHNHLASFFEMTIPIILTLIFFKQNQTNFMKIFLYFSLFLQFSGLIISESRGGWICCLLGLIYFYIIIYNRLNKFYKRGFLIGSIFLSLMILLFFNYNLDVKKRYSTFKNLRNDSSFKCREEIWKSSIHIIKDYPFLGSGPGTFASIYHKYRDKNMHYYVNQPHNEYLGWVIETGVFSLPLILWIIWFLLKNPLNNIHNPFRISSNVAIFSLSLHSLIDYNVRIPAIGFYLALLCGLSFIKFRKES